MDNLSKSAKNAANAEDRMGNSANTASTKVGKLANTTGQANNAVIEMGRVASDAEYGLRGMGNNISQLATQIFQLMASQTQATAATETNTVATSTNAVTTKTAAKASKTATAAVVAQSAATSAATTTTLGLWGALKAIGGVMMGPLGFLFLIQGAIAGITAWANSSDDAVDSTDELTRSISDLNKEIRDNFLTEKEAAEAVKKSVENKIKMNALIVEQTEKTERLQEAEEKQADIRQDIDDAQQRMIDQKVNRSKLLPIIEKQIVQLMKDEKKATDELVVAKKDLSDIEDKMYILGQKSILTDKESLKGLREKLSEQKKEQSARSTDAKLFKEYGEKIAETQALIDAITGGKKGKPKDTSERDRAAIDAEIAAHLAKHKTLEQNEIDAAERKYDKLLKNAEKYGYKVADIEAARLHTLYDIRDEYNLLELEQEQAKNDSLFQLKLNQQNWEDSTIEDPMNRLLAQAETIFLEEQQLQDKYLNEREMYQDDKEKLLELERQYNTDSQALIQERSDNAYNTIQLQKERELKAVKISEDAKATIINASANAAKSAFGLLKNLAGENKALQAAAIIGENAVGITKTIIDSTAAGAKIKAVGLAAASTAAVNPVSAAMVAATPALLAANRLNAAASIATSVGAATQGLTALGESGNVSGGNVPDSGSGEIPAPTFNLVEGSEGNQIQNSIQNAGDTPVRAFVVADDITSQQSLDRQIEANSGI